MKYSTPIRPPCNPSLISAPCPPNLPTGLERVGFSSCLPQEDCKSMALATASEARLTFQRVLLGGGVVGAARIEESVAQRVPTDSVSNSSRFRIILIPFQDETNNATLSSWQDHEEPMSSWSHPLGRLCNKPRTSGNSGKPWRCCSQRS